MTNQIEQTLTRRVEKILPSKQQLQKLLESGKTIKLYQGFDPTGGRLHLGHTVGLRKLMDFANLGHQVIFLFGTGTVLVGDPSERDTGRKLITQEEIDKNIQNWKDQVSPIVDFSKVTIQQNGDWLTKLTLKDIVKIGSNISAIQLFKRKSFTRRIKNGDTVWYHETMYPLLQGYDSVAMDVDLEIGGTDQEFNMLVGRELQAKMNNREKYVLTLPMILGTDGQQMSKTTGNCVWLDDSPQDMYGKIMRLPDEQIKSYWQLVTDLDLDHLDQKIKSDPLATKKDLALDITRQFHGQDEANQAADHFQSTVQDKQTPDEIIEVDLVQKSLTSLATLSSLNLGDSNSERKRLISQGGFEVDGKKITDPAQTIKFKGGEVIKFGKRQFRRIK